ncbi:MAG: hypothetical protein ACTHLD_15245 [Chitinophaga sp.]
MIRSLFSLSLFLIPISHTAAQVTGVRMRVDIPLPGQDGSIQYHETDTTSIYYYRDLILRDFTSEYMEMDMRFEKEEDQLTKLERRHTYFVYSRDSLYGYLFHLYRDKDAKDKWEQIDTVMAHHASLTMNLYKMYLETTIVASFVDTATGDLRETYTDKTSELNDTLICTYTSHMTDIPYTFDKQLDSAKGKKVRMIEIVNGERYMPEFGVTIPHRVNTIALERIPMENDQEIMGYFKRFMQLRRPETE